MDCPRLKHYARLNVDGSVSRCGHMVKMITFESYDKMENSSWLKDVKSKFASGQWPEDCVRCKVSEEINGSSVRTDMIKKDQIFKKYDPDYLVIGGVLDNVCNSGCISCNEKLSTKIGSLSNKKYFKVDNIKKFYQFPQDRICELDINGGEPTVSKNYKSLIQNLPNSIKVVRINTNCSSYFSELENLLKKKIKVILTISLDGVGKVHDFLRWPIRFEKFEANVDRYVALQAQHSNLTINTWTTVSSLNLLNLEQIIDFTERKKINHDMGFLRLPNELDIRYTNRYTDRYKLLYDNHHNDTLKNIAHKTCTLESNEKKINLFLKQQCRLRNIDVTDYFNL